MTVACQMASTCLDGVLRLMMMLTMMLMLMMTMKTW
jgi:hypothetical protein